MQKICKNIFTNKKRYFFFIGKKNSVWHHKHLERKLDQTEDRKNPFFSLISLMPNGTSWRTQGPEQGYLKAVLPS